MKILYIYEKMPGTYQKYLNTLLDTIRTTMGVKVLAYENNKAINYSIKTYGFKDNFQRLLYICQLSKYKSSDLKIMNNFDIVHLQHSFLWQKTVPLFEQKNRPKVIISLRGGDTYIKPWVSKNLKDFYENYGTKVDALITMSNHQKTYLTRWGVPENKIHVIPISFGNSSDAKPKYPNEGILKLVSAFRMTWEKNIYGTLHFGKLLKAKNIPFIYDIYGDGKDLGELYYLVDKYGLQDCVNVKGKIDNTSLKAILPQYDFFVQLSFSESLGMSVIEAQSLGVPCVVSNAGGLPEAVINGETAIVFPYNEIEGMVEEMFTIWNNKEQYFLYSKNAIKYVNSNFTLKHEEEKLSELYKRLL